MEFQSAMDTLLENSLIKDENNIDIKHEPLEDLETGSNLECYSSDDDLPISLVTKKRGKYIHL